MLIGHTLKLVGRGVDTLVFNVCYADEQGQPMKQELEAEKVSEVAFFLFEKDI